MSEKKQRIVRLDELDLSCVIPGCGTPKRNASMEGNPISIGGKQFPRGIGIRAQSVLRIDLKGGCERFSAFVGVDDESSNSNGRVEFKIYGDKRLLWQSGIMNRGGEAKEVDLCISGMDRLVLYVSHGGDRIDFDHADWAEGTFEVSGASPEAASDCVPYILTPKPPKTPRINSAKVFGIRPGSPFLFTISATGDRPMVFFAIGLPDGLQLDENSGRITGVLREEGAFQIKLVAENSLGKAQRELRIVVGDSICLTPPLGWNSWNCWAVNVDEDKIRATAKAMAEKLINHGWIYVNIDDAWQGTRGGEFNAIQPNEKFPDMKALCDYVHGLGLKIGIYSTPYVASYAGYIGGTSDVEDGAWSKEIKDLRIGEYSFAENDAKQWALWGFDYLKYDWSPNDIPHIKEMGDALKSTGRDIVYSLSNSAPFENARHYPDIANVWRTTSDIRDQWDLKKSNEHTFPLGVVDIWRFEDKWYPYNGPGHWNDPDMLVVGQVGWGELRPGELTPDEQYTHISLWCLWSAPLLIGCPIETLDDFTLGLLTNDEVLEVNQDPLGKQARPVFEEGDFEILAKEMEDGSKAVGLFNRSFFEHELPLQWSHLDIDGPHRIRDLWRQKDLGVFDHEFKATVPSHGVVLVRLFPVTQ